MIYLGEDWSAEYNRVFHVCDPDLRTALRNEQRETCQCGAALPRRVQQFRERLEGGSRDPATQVTAV
jgi:hypothetical protein